MSSEETFSKVQEVLVDALGLDDDEVTLEATLMADLGAESIDFLDIVFRLEKTFDIKIPRGELFPENLADTDSGFVVDGVVSEDGVNELRNRVPHVDTDSFAAFAQNPKVENIGDLFTVQMIVNYLESKVAA